jgi:cytochrome b subunit of formate dehydrogenase
MGLLARTLLQWAADPAGKIVPIHVAWFLIWVAAIGGLCFLIFHAVYVRYFAKSRVFQGGASQQETESLPRSIPRHSLVARLYHWIMAASMLTLLTTAFLPKVGPQFDWITWHWIAGSVLTVSVLFHIVHSSVWLDFRAIWPDRIDLQDAWRRALRAFGRPTPPPRKFAKYPLENKLYHFAVMVTGGAAIVTGFFLLHRVRTVFFTRNPYLFSDMTWGWMYVLHGLGGIGLITLVIIHIYFAVRPEKLPITKSMITGSMSRDFFVKDHDPRRWIVNSSSRDAAEEASRAG